MEGEWFKGLTKKQRKFIEAYASNGGNATDAAREAGYANPTPDGARMIRNDNIRKGIEFVRQETTNEFIATRDERQSFWSAVMRDKNEAMKNRLRASDLLGRCQGDFLGSADTQHKIIIESVQETI